MRLETTIQQERVIPKFPGQLPTFRQFFLPGFCCMICRMAGMKLQSIPNLRFVIVRGSGLGKLPHSTSMIAFFKQLPGGCQGGQNSPITGIPHNGDFLHIYLWSWKFSSCWHPDIEVSRTQKIWVFPKIGVFTGFGFFASVTGFFATVGWLGFFLRRSVFRGFLRQCWGGFLRQ